ncbi:MAG TPA: hypothetical protein VGT03_14220 [Candidatus Acidoferrales bacterium]|nr:hypothetical protein [Candidatus Acidoferrales bacterium]
MLEAAIFAAIIVILSVIGLVWDFASGLITSGVDGLLLLLICLMMAGLFSLQLLLLARRRRKGSGN